MITEITGTITHDDSVITAFRIAPSNVEAGWSWTQWGGNLERLGGSRDVVDAMTNAVQEVVTE